MFLRFAKPPRRPWAMIAVGGDIPQTLDGDRTKLAKLAQSKLASRPKPPSSIRLGGLVLKLIGRGNTAWGDTAQYADDDETDRPELPALVAKPAGKRKRPAR